MFLLRRHQEIDIEIFSARGSEVESGAARNQFGDRKYLNEWTDGRD